jgi:hypothetical protein
MWQAELFLHQNAASFSAPEACAISPSAFGGGSVTDSVECEANIEPARSHAAYAFI